MRFRITDAETPGALQLYTNLSVEDLISAYRSEDEEEDTPHSVQGSELVFSVLFTSLV